MGFFYVYISVLYLRQLLAQCFMLDRPVSINLFVLEYILSGCLSLTYVDKLCPSIDLKPLS